MENRDNDHAENRAEAVYMSIITPIYEDPFVWWVVFHGALAFVGLRLVLNG